MDVVESLKYLLRQIVNLLRRSTPSVEELRAISDTTSQLMRILRSALPGESMAVEQMTYSMALGFFVSDRPKDTAVVKGAMLIQDHEGGKLFTQVFLDRNNHLVCDRKRKPYGRQLVVGALDQELLRTFGDRDLVIVE